jgi:hypothetical protein
VHWLAYAAFPMTVLHSITSSGDLQSGFLLALTIGCVLSVAAAVGYRIIAARSARLRASRPLTVSGFVDDARVLEKGAIR